MRPTTGCCRVAAGRVGWSGAIPVRARHVGLPHGWPTGGCTGQPRCSSSGTSSVTAASPAADSRSSSRSWRGRTSCRSGSREVVCLPVSTTSAGAERLLAILDAQLARRSMRRVPGIDEDPAWVIALPAEPAMERAAEAFGTLANGWVGDQGITGRGRARVRCRCSRSTGSTRAKPWPRDCSKVRLWTRTRTVTRAA